MEHNELIDNLSDRRKTFVTVLHETGNITEAGRQAGYAQPNASRLSKEPEIVAALHALEQYAPEGLSEDQIRQGIAKEALFADTSRDRLTALQLAAKTKGMLRDVVEETRINRTQDEFLDEIEKTFGKEARIKAESELN